MKRLRQLAQQAATREYKKSYAQCGEDLIIDFALSQMRISQPSYLDLGAHHPVYLSNTFLFYNKGGRGVCVEPDPELNAAIKKRRPRDICITAGIGVTADISATFYIMSSKTLSTFSQSDAMRLDNYGTHKIERVIQVPLLSVNEIIDRNFNGAPDFVSLDIEGLDLQVLRTLDFARYRPKIFCIETLTYTEDASEEKITDIGELLSDSGYLLYSDTYINSIYVDRNAWITR